MGVTLKVVIDQTTTYEKQGGGGIKLHDITAVFNLKYISDFKFKERKQNFNTTIYHCTGTQVESTFLG